jgi:hypothetical protein
MTKYIASRTSGATKKATNTVEKALDTVGTTVSNVAKNPLPVVETIALTIATGDPTIAAAAVSALNGGNPKQIATAAIAASVGAKVGGEASNAATSAGASSAVSQIASSAAGASSAAVTKALASGQNLGQALTAGLTSGVIGGVAAAGTEGIKSAVGTPVAGTGLKATQGQGTQLFAPDQGVTGLTSNVPTTGGQGLYGDPNAILPSSLSQYGTAPSQQKAGTSGSLVPRTESFTGGTETVKTGPVMTDTLSPESSSALRTALGLGISGAFAPSQTTPTGGGGVTISGAGQTPGSQALGQALRVGDAGAPIFGGDKDKEGKKSGWNLESLRYMGQES